MTGGTEWLVDGHGCAQDHLRDRERVLALLDRIVAALDLRVVSTAVHVFPGPGGITAMYLLAESHLTVHTFPEAGTATLNLYCCKPRPVAPWSELLAEYFGAREVVATMHRRGAAP